MENKISFFSPSSSKAQKRSIINSNFLKNAIILISLLVFSKSLTMFFHSDDWYHLALIQEIKSPVDLIQSFSFSPNGFTATHYRPISTQLFFYVFYTLFKLNPIPYFFFGLVVFAISLNATYSLSLKIIKNKTKSLITLFFYALSATHLHRLYFLSAFQEIFMFVFVFLSINSYLSLDKKQKKYISSISIFLYILALGSKETAIILLPLIIVIDIYKGQKNYYKWIPYTLISILYLIFRFGLFSQGLSTTDYSFEFTIKNFFINIDIYISWMFGLNEYILGLRHLLKIVFYNFFKLSKFTFIFFINLILLSITSFFINIKNMFKNDSKKRKEVLFSIIWILLGLTPVLFLKNHNFMLTTTLPLFGFSMFLANAFYSLKKNLSKIIFILLFLSINFLSIFRESNNHYIFIRSNYSKQIVEWLKINHPEKPSETIILDENTITPPNKHYFLEEIREEPMGNNIFKSFYEDRSPNIFFKSNIMTHNREITDFLSISEVISY